jgi:hypothetical protein
MKKGRKERKKLKGELTELQKNKARACSLKSSPGLTIILTFYLYVV